MAFYAPLPYIMRSTLRHEEDEVDPYHHHRNDNGQHFYRQGRQQHPHHMVRQPRSRSAASLPIGGVDVTASPPHPPPGVAPNGMPPNAPAAAMRRESAVSVTSLSVYDPMGCQMTGSAVFSKLNE